jgi:hypothetical protein
MIAAVGAHVIAAGGAPSSELLSGDPGLPVSVVHVRGEPDAPTAGGHPAYPGQDVPAH